MLPHNGKYCLLNIIMLAMQFIWHNESVNLSVSTCGCFNSRIDLPAYSPPFVCIEHSIGWEQLAEQRVVCVSNYSEALWLGDIVHLPLLLRLFENLQSQ